MTDSQQQALDKALKRRNIYSAGDLDLVLEAVPAVELLQRWIDSHDAGYPASLVLSENVCEDTRKFLKESEPA